MTKDEGGHLYSGWSASETASNLDLPLAKQGEEAHSEALGRRGFRGNKSSVVVYASRIDHHRPKRVDQIVANAVVAGSFGLRLKSTRAKSAEGAIHTSPACKGWEPAQQEKEG